MASARTVSMQMRPETAPAGAGIGTLRTRAGLVLSIRHYRLLIEGAP